MKIILIPGSTYSDATTRSVFDGLSNSYAALGHEARILSRPAPSLPGLNFKAGDRPKLLPPKGRALRHRLGEIFRENDFVHLHFSGLFRSWMRVLPGLARKGPARLAVTFQDYAHPELPANSAWKTAMLRRLLDRASVITAVSDHLGQKISHDFPQARRRLQTIHNGVPLSGVPIGKKAPPTRKPFILSIGRLAPYKGTDLLLMAFSKLDRDDVDLVLCGAPFHQGHMGNLIIRLGLTGRAHLTGLIPQKDVRALLMSCLFYAAAPRTETFGMAVAEAMAAGKAVVAARTGGIPEFVEDKVSGLLIKPKNVDALALGMKRLLSDAGLRRRLGRNGRKAVTRLGWDKIARAYLRIYRSNMGRPGE